MIATCLPCYLIVEIPALAFMGEDKEKAAEQTRPFVWIGVVLCFIMFAGYIGLQYRLANAEQTPTTAISQRLADTMVKAIDSGRMSLRGVLAEAVPRPSAPGGVAYEASSGRPPNLQSVRRQWGWRAFAYGDGQARRCTRRAPHSC